MKTMRIACVLKAYFSPILYSLQRLSNDFRYDMCRFSLSKSPVKPRGIPVLPRSLRFHASKQFDFFPSDDRATCNVILEYFRPRKEEAIQIFNSPPILRRLQPLLPMHLLRRRRASPALPQAVPRTIYTVSPSAVVFSVRDIGLHKTPDNLLGATGAL